MLLVCDVIGVCKKVHNEEVRQERLAALKATRQQVRCSVGSTLPVRRRWLPLVCCGHGPYGSAITSWVQDQAPNARGAVPRRTSPSPVVKVRFGCSMNVCDVAPAELS